MDTGENSPSADLHRSSDALHGNALESENLNFFNDLDEYINEIKSRLAVSKMVSNSILKGVVTAIEHPETPKSLDASTIVTFEDLTMKQVLKVKLEIKKMNHHKDSLNLTKETEELARILQSLFKQAKETKSHQESHLETHIENTVTSVLLKGHLERIKPAKENHTLRRIAALRDQLDEISKSFTETESFFASTDHQKEPTSQVALKALRWEENGKSDPSVITMPENLDLSQLKHFTKDELGNYLKLEMMKLKRHFEHRIHQMTDEIFALKRDYSKGRTSWKLHTHEHQKVPEIIQSIREILDECGSSVAPNAEKMNAGNLVAENHHLKEMLAEKERSVHCLSSKLSDATENLSKQFVAELKLKRMLNDVKKEKQDVYTETLMSNELFVFVLKEAVSDAKLLREEPSSDHSDVAAREAELETEAKTKRLEDDKNEEIEAIGHRLEDEKNDEIEAIRHRLEDEKNEEIEAIGRRLEAEKNEEIEAIGQRLVDEKNEEIEAIGRRLENEKNEEIEAIGQRLVDEKNEEIEAIRRKTSEFCERMDEFEKMALENMRRNSVRLESLRGSFGGGHVVKILKGKLERKVSDLEKAEAEVDLLGDEVDALLCLLEKIYIALDHYSPVLVHYPGVIEILKLIRRELCGQNSKHF